MIPKSFQRRKGSFLYDEIYEKAVAIGIGMSSEEVIDEINILQATYKAMQQAISKLSIKPDLLLNDAVTIPDVEIEQVPIIKGDAKAHRSQRQVLLRKLQGPYDERI